MQRVRSCPSTPGTITSLDSVACVKDVGAAGRRVFRASRGTATSVTPLFRCACPARCRGCGCRVGTGAEPAAWSLPISALSSSTCAVSQLSIARLVRRRCRAGHQCRGFGRCVHALLHTEPAPIVEGCHRTRAWHSDSDSPASRLATSVTSRGTTTALRTARGSTPSPSVLHRDGLGVFLPSSDNPVGPPRSGPSLRGSACSYGSNLLGRATLAFPQPSRHRLDELN